MCNQQQYKVNSDVVKIRHNKLIHIYPVVHKTQDCWQNTVGVVARGVLLELHTCMNRLTCMIGYLKYCIENSKSAFLYGSYISNILEICIEILYRDLHFCVDMVMFFNLGPNCVTCAFLRGTVPLCI